MEEDGTWVSVVEENGWEELGRSGSFLSLPLSLSLPFLTPPPPKGMKEKDKVRKGAVGWVGGRKRVVERDERTLPPMTNPNTYHIIPSPQIMKENSWNDSDVSSSLPSTPSTRRPSSLLSTPPVGYNIIIRSIENEIEVFW